MPSHLTAVSSKHGSRRNEGLERWETDHVPAATKLPGRAASRNHGLHRTETDHPPAKTKLHLPLPAEHHAAATSHKSSAKVQESSRHASTRHGSTRASEIPKDLTRATSKHTTVKDLTRATSKHTTTKDLARASSRHAGGTTVTSSRALPTRPTTNYGPTRLTVHNEVTQVSRSTRPQHWSAKTLFAAALKAKFGRGPDDPRSLDTIVEGKYFEGKKVGDWAREEFGVSPRDRRPLEDILDEVEARGTALGPASRSRTLKRRDSFSSDEDDFLDDEWDLGSSLRTMMPRGTGNGKKRGRVSRMLRALIG